METTECAWGAVVGCGVVSTRTVPSSLPGPCEPRRCYAAHTRTPRGAVDTRLGTACNAMFRRGPGRPGLTNSEHQQVFLGKAVPRRAEKRSEVNTRDSRQIRSHRVRSLVLGGDADAGAEQAPTHRSAVHPGGIAVTNDGSEPADLRDRAFRCVCQDRLGQPRAVRGASEAAPRPPRRRRIRRETARADAWQEHVKNKNT